MTTSLAGRRLVIETLYEGPFERIANRLWAIDPKTNTLRFEVSEGTARDRLALLADRAHRVWINHYAIRQAEPADRWKRRIRLLVDDET